MAEDIVTLDARQLACPLPVLKLKKALNDNPGKQVLLQTTDRGSLLDVPSFCEYFQAEYTLLQEAPHIEFKVQKEAQD